MELLKKKEAFCQGLEVMLKAYRSGAYPPGQTADKLFDFIGDTMAHFQTTTRDKDGIAIEAEARKEEKFRDRVT